MPNFDQASRLRYSRDNPTVDDLQLGCMQRIADATELMAKNHGKLIRDLELSERSKKYWMEDCDCLIKKNRALRGVITKLKNKQKH